jgi:hypothetical protein
MEEGESYEEEGEESYGEEGEELEPHLCDLFTFQATQIKKIDS